MVPSPRFNPMDVKSKSTTHQQEISCLAKAQEKPSGRKSLYVQEVPGGLLAFMQDEGRCAANRTRQTCNYRWKHAQGIAHRVHKVIMWTL